MIQLSQITTSTIGQPRTTFATPRASTSPARYRGVMTAARTTKEAAQIQLALL